MTKARPQGARRPGPRPKSGRSSPALVGSTSRPRLSSAAGSCGKVKSTRTRATSCNGGGRTSPTSGTSKGCSISRLRTFCAEVSPARTSAAPGQARDCVADEVASGSSSPEPFARRHRSSWSWKTSGACAVAGSTKSSRTWPKQGSMRNGQAFERPTSAPRTVAKGCSSRERMFILAYCDRGLVRSLAQRLGLGPGSTQHWSVQAERGRRLAPAMLGTPPVTPSGPTRRHIEGPASPTRCANGVPAMPGKLESVDPVVEGRPSSTRGSSRFSWAFPRATRSSTTQPPTMPWRLGPATASGSGSSDPHPPGGLTG